MKIVSPLLALVALTAACGSEPKTSSAPTTTGAAQSNSAIKPNAAAPTTYQQLQGKWQSTTDAKSIVEFEGHQYIDYYNGKKLGTTAFVLDQACPGTAGTGHPDDNGKFLVQPQENMCWEILAVDEKDLELSYIARGNTLKYRRVQ